MASLDNFHTGNPAPVVGPHDPYHRRVTGRQVFRDHLGERHAALQHALVAGSGRNEYWDLANQVPLAPVQPIVDPVLLTGRTHPDPTYTEVAESRLNGRYVAMLPRTRLRTSGDTAEYKQLVAGTTCLRSRLMNLLTGGGNRRSVAPLNTYTRYHPYLGR